MEDELSSANLPVARLQLDAATLKLIESSKVKLFIGPLIAKLHEKQAQKIAILAWDSDESAREVAKILTTCISQQLDIRCAMVIMEGIRLSVENYDSFAAVTLPEVESSGLSEQARHYVDSMNRNFPVQVLVGPSISSWTPRASTKWRIALGTDAQILLIPREGYVRGVARKIRKFAKTNKMTWLGAISLNPTWAAP